MNDRKSTKSKELFTPPSEKLELVFPDRTNEIDDDSCSSNHFADIFNHAVNKPTTSLLDYIIYVFKQLYNFSNSNHYHPSGYWRYVLGVYKNLFLVFYFNWFSIITSPLSSLAFITIYPIVSLLLFLFEIGLKICLEDLGGEKLIQTIREEYGNSAPDLLYSNKSIQIVKSTLPSLGGKPVIDRRINRNFIGNRRILTFDISIAQTMTILSSLVYERQDEKITKALKLIAQIQNGKASSQHEEKEKEFQRIKCIAKQLIWESEANIRYIADQFNLYFSGVTEMRSLTGPYCGLFWPKDNDKPPFIIVTFKGTTPTNYSEFLVDATFQRTDARPFLFGSVHQGFYESLFAENSCRDRCASNVRDPYYVILSAIRQKAKELLANRCSDGGTNPQPVPVWLAGHSLGAGLSSLLFARWLKCPDDLGPLCRLCDAYVIGLPAVGDNDFASNFASCTNSNYYQPQDMYTTPPTLWRIVNQFDVICRLPPGYNSSIVGNYAPKTDFFNYAHVGQVVQLTHPLLNDEPLKTYPSPYETAAVIEVIDTASSFSTSSLAEKTSNTELDNNSEPCTPVPEELQDERLIPTAIRHASAKSLPSWLKFLMQQLQYSSPITMLESLYPFFIRDHIPVHYFEGLDKIRDYQFEK
ncbi:Alpha/Beta hydrolase protein [Mycotypha africana]|uniref:Alpha/Beta hydrolase protein n=1 Tax=Mycotypha africana TaxID=64632 RepID=UPI002301C0DF|nr:Alpha/Beta hydrolase protein [Mycotypha africana]KAI8969319.1 Alpha/Beta hydrolase protein [Mycotypha africana]